MKNCASCKHKDLMEWEKPCLFCDETYPNYESMSKMATFYNEILDYLQVLEVPGIPYVSYSHYTLHRIYVRYGEKRVDNFLAEYWRKV